MEKIWEIKPKVYDDLISQILYNRGIITENINQKTIDNFLHPDFDRDFHDPKKLPDYKKAIDRIKKSISKKERIGIYADYDADGIPGAAMLFRTLLLFGLEPEIYIPTRDVGYGFNRKGLDFLIDQGCKLIISIDLGIREIEFSEYLHNKGVDLIITDHHIPDEKPPKALAIIDPKINNSGYPFSELSGAGVIYKIIQGLSCEYPEIITESFLKWNLDLVAISTISDVVPLVDENRLIAFYGLKVLEKSRNEGIKAIYKVAGIDNKKIDAYIVGFQIGPRINAPGRIDHATVSFELLTTTDADQAYKFAVKLEEQNARRQKMMEEAEFEAEEMIKKNNFLKNKILILSSKKWNKGILGPVASKISEKFCRPTILFQEDKEKYVGSARSFAGLNIVEALSKVSHSLIAYGGHAGAAGVQVKNSKFEKFSKELIDHVNKLISENDLIPRLPIDCEIGRDQINITNFKKILQLAPFGLGNPKPLLVCRNLELDSHRMVGRDEKHLQLKFRFQNKVLKGIVFNHVNESVLIKTGESYDIVFTPDLNFWNGKWWADLQIRDFKLNKKNVQE